MGYGVFDHYDLGNYDQKGTVETRFGSRSELEAMITKMHSNNIEVYADIILNHIYTNEDESENNPAVKAYVFDEAYRNSTQFQQYRTKATSSSIFPGSRKTIQAHRRCIRYRRVQGITQHPRGILL